MILTASRRESKRIRYSAACRWFYLAAFCLIQASCFGIERQSLQAPDLAQIRFEQKLDQQLSLALPFVDETGQPVTLARYFHGKSVLIVPGYYGCPMLCGLVANGLIEALQDIKGTPGRDFEIVFVSINPSETPSLALAKKNSYLKRYGRAQSADGWHFLTGSEPAIRATCDQLGFHYAYDFRSKEYAHPSGVVVATPDGRVAQYLLGVTCSAADLNAAIKRASARQISSPMRDLLLLCFHYTPITGKYGALVIGLVRATAVLTLLGVAGAIYVAHRHRRKAA